MDRTLKRTQVAVIGAGVAGLNTARLLVAAGVSVEVFEARDRVGGRVLTVDGVGNLSDDGFDFGPSWFWPRLQPAIRDLSEELGLASFAQHSSGDVVFERMSREPAHRLTGLRQEPDSLRFAGGSAALVRGLADRVPSGHVHLNSTVTGLALQEETVGLTISSGSGEERHRDAEYVVAALPPRLLEATIGFSPEVGSEFTGLWRRTPTWMAAQAKLFALYDSPFWREAGLSGTAQSMVGPMPEIHDATLRSGRAALFGFVGVGPAERAALGEQALTEACIAQFVRIFGDRAGTPIATLYKDWASDPLTATAEDPTSTGHPEPAPSWVPELWQRRLILAGSETSPREGGYLAGAAEASILAAAEIRRRLAQGARA